MSHKISNESVVERIMRMGVEHKSGVPIDALWDLAVKQLAKSDVKNATSTPDFIQWLKDTKNNYVFMYVKDILNFVKLPENISDISCVDWKCNNTVPVIKFK